MVKNILVFFLLLGSWSCSTEKPKEISEDEVKLVIASSNSTSNLTKYLRIKSVLSLKQTDDFLIGDVSKLLEYKGLFYVMDRKQTQSLVVYDSIGNPIKKITNKGKGPGEVNKISDFTIDKKTHQITVLSKYPNKLIHYTLEGDFIREKRVKKDPMYYTKLPSGEEVYEVTPRKSNKYFYYIVNDKIQLKQATIAEKKGSIDRIMRATGGGFKEINGVTLSIPTMSNKIYEIKREGTTVKYELDLGDWTPSYEKFERKEDIAFNLSFSPTNEHILISYFVKEIGIQACILNRMTNNYMIGNPNKESFLHSIFLWTIYSNENEFYSVLDRNMLEYWKKAMNGEMKTKFPGTLFSGVDLVRRQFESLDPNDFTLLKYSIEGV